MKASLINRMLLSCVSLAIFLMATIKIGDYDIWYHLRAGQYIISTFSINHLDPFSFTAGDQPWSVQSWLAGVIFYAVYSLGGVYGLSLFNALLIIVIFFFLYRTLILSEGEEESKILFAVFILIVASFSVRFRMVVRPHIFEFLFLSSVLYIMNLYLYKKKSYLFLLPLIQILWVNIHGSHILGLIIPLLYLIGGLCSIFLKRGGFQEEATFQMARAMAIVLLMNVLATFINPVTYEAFILPFIITGQKTYMQSIGEWQPLNLYYLWGYGLRYTWAFSVFFVLGILGFLYQGKRSNFIDILLFVAFFIMALKGIRLMAEFAIVTAPVIFRSLSSPFFSVVRTREKVVGVLLLLVMILGVLPTIVFSPTYSFGLGVKENIFPERAVSFIEKRAIPGNVFNSFAFGDYLVWKSFPERKVFIHGRNEVFPEDFYKEYLDAHTSQEVWKKVTERYNITFTLLEYYLTDYEGKEAVLHLDMNPEWVPVYWDRVSIVYVKDLPETLDIIKKWGYKYIHPSYFDFSYLDSFVHKGLSNAVLSELDRLTDLSPDNEEAYLARAYVFFRLGRDYYTKSMADLKRAISINPNRAISHSAIGILYQKTGNFSKAKKSFKEALAMDTRDQSALMGLETMKDKEE